MNIHLILQMASEAMGEREALVNGDSRYSYADLAHMAQGMAARVGAGEKLAYLHEASPAMPAALFGAALAGVPFVPINYRLADEQIDQLLARTAPAVLLSERTVDVSGIRPISPSAPFTQFFEGEAPDDDNGIAVELFTSGTTGAPKSAILRHRNLMAYILGAVEFMSAGEDEATLVSVPPYHIAGISAVLSSTYAGRRMVQLPNFTPEHWLRLAKDEGITHAFVVPTMLQRILEKAQDDPEMLDLPALRNIAYGGGKMPLSVIRQAVEALPHVNFTNAYGLTETSSTICVLTPDDHRTALASSDTDIQKRLGSVGRILPSVEIEIRDEDGTPLGPDEAGLVFVRGDQISGEYKNQADPTKSDPTHSDGWFATKDRGYLDADGYLFLDGRDDDVIVRGGENISPGEIEDVLRTHKAVRDVAVIGTPDTEWGEAVTAVIVRAPNADCDSDNVCEFVRNALRSSRVPSRVEFVDALPYNETGKLLRRVLRDQFTPSS